MKVNKNVVLAVALFSVLMMPEMAFAAEIGEALLTRIGNALTGPYATAIGIIMIAAVGYSCLKGRIDWGWGGAVMAGLTLIFGAATIIGMARG